MRWLVIAGLAVLALLGGLLWWNNERVAPRDAGDDAALDRRAIGQRYWRSGENRGNDARRQGDSAGDNEC